MEFSNEPLCYTGSIFANQLPSCVFKYSGSKVDTLQVDALKYKLTDEQTNTVMGNSPTKNSQPLHKAKKTNPNGQINYVK